MSDREKINSIGEKTLVPVKVNQLSQNFKSKQVSNTRFTFTLPIGLLHLLHHPPPAIPSALQPIR